MIFLPPVGRKWRFLSIEQPAHPLAYLSPSNFSTDEYTSARCLLMNTIILSSIVQHLIADRLYAELAVSILHILRNTVKELNLYPEIPPHRMYHFDVFHRVKAPYSLSPVLAPFLRVMPPDATAHYYIQSTGMHLTYHSALPFIMNELCH